jgi:hypothetical protein
MEAGFARGLAKGATSMLRKLRDVLLSPLFLILALVLPEDVDDKLRAERELIGRPANENRGSQRRRTAGRKADGKSYGERGREVPDSLGRQS